MKNFFRNAFVAAATALCACATTSIVTQSDPEYSEQRYYKILIHFDFADYEQRTHAENYAVNKIQRLGGHAMPAHKVFFVARQYSREEYRSILLRHGIDAVLLATPTGSGSTTSAFYIPEKKETTGSAWISGNNVYTKETTTTTKAVTYQNLWANFDIELIDPVKSAVMWYASAKSGGDIFSGWTDLIKSVATTTVDYLIKDKKIFTEK